MHRIGASHVGGQRVILEIQLQRLGVVDHVLDHRAELAGRGKDLWFRLWVEADGLSIAAALEIERTAI